MGAQVRFAWIPYLTLLIGCVLTQFRSQPWQEQAVTRHRAARRGLDVGDRHGPGPVVPDAAATRRIYFVGFLGLATWLIVRDPLFFVYAITGFFHAYLLRPWPVSFAGVAATSIVVNSLILIDDPRRGPSSSSWW